MNYKCWYCGNPLILTIYDCETCYNHGDYVIEFAINEFPKMTKLSGSVAYISFKFKDYSNITTWYDGETHFYDQEGNVTDLPLYFLMNDLKEIEIKINMIKIFS